MGFSLGMPFTQYIQAKVFSDFLLCNKKTFSLSRIIIYRLSSWSSFTWFLKQKNNVYLLSPTSLQRFCSDGTVFNPTNYGSEWGPSSSPVGVISMSKLLCFNPSDPQFQCCPAPQTMLNNCFSSEWSRLSLKARSRKTDLTILGGPPLGVQILYIFPTP